MKINEDILNALNEATRNRGGQTELANKSGVEQSYISKYLSGKNKEMELENWLKLYPHIKQYLPDNAVSLEGNGMIGNLIQNGGNNSIHTKGDITNNIHKANDDYKKALHKKILNNDDLTAEEKVKMLKLLDE